VAHMVAKEEAMAGLADPDLASLLVKP